jgi:hypothetical protein
MAAHPLPLLLQLLDGAQRFLLLVQADGFVLNAVVQRRQLLVQLTLAPHQQITARPQHNAIVMADELPERAATAV